MKWWRRRDSNPRPPRCERGALPTELLPRNSRSRTFLAPFLGAVKTPAGSCGPRFRAGARQRPAVSRGRAAAARGFHVGSAATARVPRPTHLRVVALPASEEEEDERQAGAQQEHRSGGDREPEPGRCRAPRWDRKHPVSVSQRGLLPAVRGSQPRLGSAPRTQARTGGSRGKGRGRARTTASSAVGCERRYGGAGGPASVGMRNQTDGRRHLVLTHQRTLRAGCGTPARPPMPGGAAPRRPRAA